MKSLQAFKLENDDFQVEYEILSPIDPDSIIDADKQEILLAIQDVDKQISMCEDEIAKLNADIDKLTNHADGLDCAVAVASGVITALIDSFFGDEIKKITDSFVNNSVINSAKNQKIKSSIKKAEETAKEKSEELSAEAKKSIRKSIEKQYTAKRDSNGVVSKEEEKRILSKAIRWLENNKVSPTDNIWNFKGTTVTSKSHHLDDLSHHASIIGLAASIITQFTHKGYFFDKTGTILDLSDKGIPITIDDENKELFGENIPSKIACGAVNWFWHLASDIAGTSGKNAGGGMGVPGPLLSLIKGFSSIPIIKETKLSEFANYIFTDDDIRFDLRKEISQSIPVLMNEILVRVFYSIRGLIQECNEKKQFKDFNWKKILPFGNRTINRMMTIATGTFVAVDLTDAAIRGVVGSGGNWAIIAKEFILHVNFVGIGRFAIAVGTDVRMGIKRGKLVNERIKVMGQELTLLNTKVYYKCGVVHLAEVDMLEAEETMWITAKDTAEALNEVYESTREAAEYIEESLVVIHQDMEKISSYKDAIEKHNPGLVKNIVDTLKY